MHCLGRASNSKKCKCTCNSSYILTGRRTAELRLLLAEYANVHASKKRSSVAMIADSYIKSKKIFVSISSCAMNEFSIISLLDVHERNASDKQE